MLYSLCQYTHIVRLFIQINQSCQTNQNKNKTKQRTNTYFDIFISTFEDSV